MSLPNMTVVGTVVADPELRFTPGGAAVANFTVAANERRKNKDTGEWEDASATFVRCNVWRQHAENVAESLTRGMRVIVTGRLKQREYQTSEGEKRTVFDLEVDEVGPTLQWATAKVNKVRRDNAGAPSTSSSPADDPWGSAPAAAARPMDDEPPF